MKETAKTAAWAKRYRTALSRHLKQGPAADLQPALRLGRQAAALGLEPLDVAQTHEQALQTLVLPGGSALILKRYGARPRKFFEEALVPLEQTHAAAREDDLRVVRLSRTLRTRTAQSTASTRRLAQGVVRRQASEKALAKSGEHHARLLRKSRLLQGRLRGQMRKILSAQENERQNSSLRLQNEIAQVLVAIHIRLLALKEATKANAESLKKEIAETQRLVKQSVQTIQRLAYESGVHHET